MALFGKSTTQKNDLPGRYVLTFTIEGEEPFEVAVDQKIVVGSSAKCSVNIEDMDLAPRHYILKVAEDILTLHYHGPDGASRIGKQKLSQGKMYILEDGDTLIFEGVEVEVSKIVEDIDEEKDEAKGPGDDTLISTNREALEDLEQPEEVDEFDEVTVARLIAGDTDENERPEEKDLAPKKNTVSTLPTSTPPAQVAASEPDPFDPEPEAPPAPARAKKARIAGNRAPRTLPTAKANKVSRQKMHYPSGPGFLGRFFSLLFSGTIVWLAYKNLPPDMIATIQEDLVALITPLLERLYVHLPDESFKVFFEPELIGLVLFYFAAWWLVELAMALLFGGALGLFIQGFRDRGSFLGKRAKSVFRLLLIIIFLPLPIVFLPILWGSRPLSDVLSATRWESPPTWRHAVGKLLYIPALILFAIFAEDLYALSRASSWGVKPFASTAQNTEIKTWDWGQWDKWRILPGPNLNSWRLRSGVPGELVFEKKKLESYLGFWHQMRRHNYALDFLQPELAAWLEAPDSPPSAQAQAQAQEVLLATFNLSLESAPEAIKTLGPLLGTATEARQSLREELAGLRVRAIELISFAGGPHLLLSYRPKSETFAVALVPLLSKEAQAYLVSGPLSLESEAEAVVDFLLRLKVPNNWEGARSKEARTFALLWPALIEAQALTDAQQKELTSLLKDLGGEAVGTSEYPFASDYLDFLHHLKTQYGSKIPSFNQFLDNAIQAVEQRDPAFFIGEL